MRLVMSSRPLRNCEGSADRIPSITTIQSRPGRSSLTGACSMFSSANRSRLLGAAMSAAAAAATSAAEPGSFGYGKLATPEQIAGWNIDVRGDDGAGLPSGSGDVARGTEVFSGQCAGCHGTFGEGKGRLS